MHPLPSIAVLPTKMQRGLNSLAEDWPPPLDCLPFEAALQREYTTDAHFVTYTVPSADEGFPRLNKPVLGDLEAHGASVLCTMLVLDYDNPGHAAWTEDALRAFLTRVDDSPLIPDWTAFYTTLHGARFIYVLEQPVPALEAEQRLLSLVAKFHKIGIAVDTATKDWTRLFRLPHVTRDGTPTWDDPLCVCAVNPDARLALAAVPALGQANPTTALVSLEEDQPDADEAQALLRTANDRGASEWYKIAKRSLSGRECFGCVFEGDDLAAHGERNPTVISYAGQVVSLLHHRPGTTAQKCYALLLPAVTMLSDDDGGRSWENTLWHGIKLAWEREDGRAVATKKEKAREEIEVVSGKDRLLAGVRTWASEAGFAGATEGELWDWIKERMLIGLHGQYFVLRPDGFYSRTSTRKDALPAHIRRLGSDRYLDFWIEKTDEDGNTYLVERAIGKVVSDHLTAVDGINGRANLRGAVLTRVPGGKTYLTHSIYSLRRDITGEYSKDVDDWLHALCGDAYEKVIEWLGHALDFSRPICAMSVHGETGCGKKLLTQGLAECITSRAIADGQELIDEYQFSIGDTPFLVINEGFPRSKFGRSAADNFRRWVGGDPICVNAKFQIPLVINSPMRIILTANNDKVVRAITQGHTLSREDRNAIAARIFHWRAHPLSGKWLVQKGGRDYTDGWIDGDDGKVGDATVAKHFLWLHENRAAPRGTRFLVEGGIEQEIILEMALESGIMPDVIESLIYMLSDQSVRNGMHIDEETGQIFVVANAVVNYWNLVMRPKRAGRGQGLHHRSVGNALRTIMRAGWRDGAHRINGTVAKWFLVDSELLLRASITNGFDNDKLIALMEKEQAYDQSQTV